MADPSFSSLGSLFYAGSTSYSELTTTIANVSSGDLMVVIVQRDYQGNCTGVASTQPALTFNKLKTADASTNEVFLIDMWAAIATEAASSMNITASYSNAQPWGAIFSLKYSGFSPASITVNASNAHTTLQASSTNRTIGNITTNARTLLLAAGTDYDFFRTHTAASGWTKRVDSDTFGNDATTQFFYDRIANAGTYPNGNFGSVNLADRYIAMIVAIEIPDAATVTPWYYYAQQGA